ncbi:MAG: hypothetical protein AAB683_01475, partial [Patescibacteria group bacterium]
MSLAPSQGASLVVSLPVLVPLLVAPVQVVQVLLFVLALWVPVALAQALLLVLALRVPPQVLQVVALLPPLVLGLLALGGICFALGVVL